ncbi:MAG: hypothetical protein ACI9FR_002726 [Cryomorphaceae bacterium]
MDILEITEASFKLGMPMAVISWYMFSKLHKQGRLDIAGNRKSIQAELKQMKKSHKSDKSTKTKISKADKTPLTDKLRNTYFTHVVNVSENRAENTANYFFDRWMWFGSGFYGLAALWTLLVVEVMDVINFVISFPGLNKLFADGVVSLVVDLVLNQITNIISAFIWFTYWGNDSVVTWFLTAYLGYMAGMKVAQFQQK